MLTQMESAGKSYEEVLSLAQQLGFAESDPTNDVDGIDSAYKMVILSHFAYGMKIKFADVKREGIRRLQVMDVRMANLLGYVFKLIGRTRKINGAIDVEVAPVLISKTHPLASVSNEMNAVFVKSAGIRESMYYGPGAGGLPTAISVVADLVEIAKNVLQGKVGIPFTTYEKKTKFALLKEVIDRYYLNVKIPDKEGKLAQLMEIFAVVKIGIKQIHQNNFQDEFAKVIILTNEMSKEQKTQLILRSK